ncbi:unnamed protein product, partial [Diatraea saccharalis]
EEFVNMSDNEDLLGDDLGDHSLADYNLGNEEEEQLLADDYETSSSQNVPTSIGPSYGNVDMVSTDYSSHTIQYNTSQIAETECVVPNITVEVPNTRLPDHSTYAPYEPPVYEPENAVVPPAIPAAPLESPQIVPTDVPVPVSNGEGSASRARFRNERTAGAAHRAPLVRDIPDTLDKVLIPRGGGFVGRGRSSWRNPHYQPRYNHPYRRNNMPRGNFNQRQTFPPPQMRPSPPHIRPELHPEIRQNIRPEFRPDMRPEIRPVIRPEIRSELHPDIRPDMRLDIRPDMRPEMRPDIRPDIIRPDMRMDMRPDVRPDMRPDMHSEVQLHPEMRPDIRPDRPDIRLEPMQQMPPRMGPEISPERPMLSEMQFRPESRFGPTGPRPNFRPNIDERPFGPRPPYHYPRASAPGFEHRAFGPPIREIVPNDVSHMPQVTIRQQLPMSKMEKFGPGPKPREQEVIMLPVQLPPNLPPGGLAGKKVLINPHFKGNFQPPVEGPVKDIDDAAERFIAEQRNALARAANRKIPPQRYIENTTIEIENDLMGSRRSDSDLELLRRQEEFIHANRAGLRRRMRSPSPARRSASPRRSPDRRHRPERADRPDRLDRPERPHDEDSEYRRRLREQETMRERVLRAKEVRRRKNAVALQKQLDERERERQDKAKDLSKPEENKDKQPDNPTSTEDTKPDTTRKSPEKEIKVEKVTKVEKIVKEEKVEKIRDRSPVKEEKVEVNSTCEGLTPPRSQALTPPLPQHDSDDDLDLILGDIDGILSDDDTTPPVRSVPPATTSTTTDLRSKLPAKNNPRPPRQKIVFHDTKEKTPPRRAVVTSSTKAENSENNEKKNSKAKPKADSNSNKSRPRIIFDNKEKAENDGDDKRTFANRRVILQRTTTAKDKTANVRDDAESMRPVAGMFSRAVRTAINDCGRRSPEIVTHSAHVTHSTHVTQVTHATRSATVSQLPPGMTHARLRALAGTQLQSLSLDKEERVAKITFNTSEAAESFKKKFNNKMVAASKLVVILH